MNDPIPTAPVFSTAPGFPAMRTHQLLQAAAAERLRPLDAEPFAQRAAESSGQDFKQ